MQDEPPRRRYVDKTIELDDPHRVQNRNAYQSSPAKLVVTNQNVDKFLKNRKIKPIEYRTGPSDIYQSKTRYGESYCRLLGHKSTYKETFYTDTKYGRKFLSVWRTTTIFQTAPKIGNPSNLHPS